MGEVSSKQKELHTHKMYYSVNKPASEWKKRKTLKYDDREITFFLLQYRSFRDMVGRNNREIPEEGRGFPAFFSVRNSPTRPWFSLCLPYIEGVHAIFFADKSCWAPNHGYRRIRLVLWLPMSIPIIMVQCHFWLEKCLQFGYYSFGVPPEL